MNITIVTAAIIQKGNKFLITQRKSGKNEALKWEFPGGKLEHGESPEKCLKREIKEELNLNIKVKDIFKAVYHEYQDITILLLAYKCDLSGGKIDAIDVNDFKWVTIEQIKNYIFAEADVPIVNKMLK